MAQIHLYTKSRTAAGMQSLDYFDVDSTEDGGLNYESAKMSADEMSLWIQQEATNLYKDDGTLTGNRTITGAGNELKLVAGNMIVEMNNLADDYGFYINDSTSTPQASLIFDQATSSAALSLSDASGEFLHANDGLLGVGLVSSGARIETSGLGNTSGTVNMHLKKENGDTLQYVRDDGFFGFGSNTKSFTEDFRFEGKGRFSDQISIYGNNSGTAAINVAGGAPSDIVIQKGGAYLELVGSSAAIGTIGSTFRLYANTNIEMFRIDRNAIGGARQIMIPAEATFGTPQRSSEFILNSSYWDGGAAVLKEARIQHLVNNLPLGESQINFDIGGTNFMFIRDDEFVSINQAVRSNEEALGVDGRLQVTHDNFVFNGTDITTAISNNLGDMLAFTTGGGVIWNNYNNGLGAPTGTQNWDSFFHEYEFRGTSNAANPTGVPYFGLDVGQINSGPLSNAFFNMERINGYPSVFNVEMNRQGALQATNPVGIELHDNYPAHSVDLAGVDYFKTGLKIELTNTFNTTTTGDGTVRCVWLDAQGGDVNEAIFIENGNIVSENMPTSSAGLKTGTLWNDSGTVKIV